MEINSENYEIFINSKFCTLPNKIEIERGLKELTPDSFKKVLFSEESKNTRNIIYIWRTEKEIPRVKGKSNIIYIGQTKRSIFERHGSYSKLLASSEANKQKFNDVVREYGAITISYINYNEYKPLGKSLLFAEGQFLWWHFKKSF
jgi:hypothetical protein